MTFRGTWIPRDDEEEDFLEAILDLARLAYENGVPATRIAGLCTFAGLSILNQTPETADTPASNGPPAGESAAEKDPLGEEPCPGCGKEIIEVTLGFGGAARVDHPDGSFCESIDIEEHPFVKEMWERDRHSV